ARCSEEFVIAGLIEMVMRIEERSDLRIRSKGFQRGKELVTALWRAAVDEDKAVSCQERHDVCSAVEHSELVGCLSTQQRRKTQGCRPRQRALQKVSTIQANLLRFLSVGPGQPISVRRFAAPSRQWPVPTPTALKSGRCCRRTSLVRCRTCSTALD